MTTKKDFILSCPLPIEKTPYVLLAHGGGGKLMHQLIEKMIAPAFKNPNYSSQHDSAVLAIDGKKMAFTTDSFVVKPLFFPGGDIGKLAVYGTVNDLAMSGAKPLYLSVGFIIEEGFLMEDLWRILESMKEAAQETGVSIVTGDTKVVDKGKGDGIFINTSGAGVIEHQLLINPSSVRSGDVILINGDIGRHGISVMAQREGLEFESSIESDCAPLSAVVSDLVNKGIEVHCLRDLTRGGLSSALNEIAEVSQMSIEIEEGKIPVHETVRSACEILGFDPLYVANEGRMVVFVPEPDAQRALAMMKTHPVGKDSVQIGRVTDGQKSVVTVKNQLGSRRVLDMLSGEQLPRIC